MEFPLLSSGELIQASTVRSQPLQHLEHIFAGFSRQTHRTTNADRKSWRLRYEKLNAEESMRLRGFFEALPIEGLFSFTDPWTAVVYPNCRIRDYHLSFTCDRDGRYSAELEVQNAD